MSKTLTFDGNGSTIATAATCHDGYCTFFFEISIFYGNLVDAGGDAVGAILPTDSLERLPENLNVVCELRKLASFSSDSVPGQLANNLKLLGRIPLFNNNSSYVGESFIFSTGRLSNHDTNPYIAMWHCGPITVSSGSNILKIIGQSGQSYIFSAND